MPGSNLNDFMRKRFLAVLLLIIVVTGCIYLLIPSHMVLSESITIEAHPSAVARCLIQPGKVKKWWTGNNNPGDSQTTLVSNGYSFRLKPGPFDVITVSTQKGQEQLPVSHISIIPLQKYSTLIRWKLEAVNGKNPFERIQSYLHARRIGKNIREVLRNFEQFMQQAENVYGLTIQNSIVSDTLLLTTRMTGTRFPSEQEYYDLIHQLQEYIGTAGATATNYPMLHIAQVDKNQFETTVAIPVNRVLADKGNIRLNRMVMGNILTAEVKGGISSVTEAMQQMENFVLENSLSSPAMPFQQLVTNRLQQRDSLQWITRVYYPVI